MRPVFRREKDNLAARFARVTVARARLSGNMAGGRATSPVGCAAFKAVELLSKWLAGSTPASSATFLFKGMELQYLFLRGRFIP